MKPGYKTLAEALPAALAAPRSAARLLLGLDFDGTLAPLKPRPELARLPDRTRRALKRLLRRRGLSVAVVSGRALPTLKAKVALPGLWYAGNHGLEIEGPGLRWTHGRAKAAAAAAARVAAALKPLLPGFPGSRLEEKGPTLSLHYRGLKSQHAQLKSILGALCRREPLLRLHGGKKVWELKPRVDWDKGRALKRIAAALPGPTRVAFIGDDKTDEEAFRRLGASAFTARVGRGRTRARYRLQGPGEVLRLLELLAR